jgi:uncharacterized membrane protein required for colicin V production
MNMFGINLVDIGVVLVVAYFLRQGYRKGFFALGLESFSFILGILLALLFYQPLGILTANIVGMSRSFAKVIAFLLIWLTIEAVVPPLTAQLYSRVPALWLNSKWNYRAGIIPGALESLILCAFMLSLAVSFPLPSIAKQHVLSSRIGQPMVYGLQNVEVFASGLFGESDRETLSFMSVGRQENVSFNLGFKTTEMFPDPMAEQLMFELINAERVKNGLKPLVQDQALTEVARLHGADMLRRGYFAHITPEGMQPSDRADYAGIDYEKFGENLAFSPDAKMAHIGLLRSERHRRNILSTQFKKVGIGVQNAGSYGLIFVQNFSD